MSSNTRSTARLVTALATTLAVAGGVTLATATSEQNQGLIRWNATD
ncbi:hypothetical protein LCL87_18650 [Rhodococcus hoagii]|nr:hypothetical protein [Prescottella equi]